MLSSSPIRNTVLGLPVATVALTACASDEAAPTPPVASEGENGDAQHVVDASRTEIIQLHPSLEGGATMRRLSLTAEPAGTLAHDRLLPRAIRFQKDPPSLVLMTRGTANNGIPDVYVVNNLLF